MCVGERPWGDEWALRNPDKAKLEQYEYEKEFRLVLSKSSLGRMPKPTTRMQLNREFDLKRSNPD